MGAFASYSGQLFNNYIAFALSIYISNKNPNASFDIFGINSENELHLKHYFIMMVLGFVIFTILYTYISLLINGFKLTKFLGYSFIAIYTVFFVAGIIFGIQTM